MADEVYRWSGGRAVCHWRVCRSADGRWLPRLRAELAALLLCGRRGHRYATPAARTAILDDPPADAAEWENVMLFRRCLNGCGCHLVGMPDPLPRRAVPPPGPPGPPEPPRPPLHRPVSNGRPSNAAVDRVLREGLGRRRHP